MSTNNILKPLISGKPIIVPQRTWCLVSITCLSVVKVKKVRGMKFSSLAEVEHALHHGVVSMHAEVEALISQLDENGEMQQIRVNTTPGRMIIWNIMPQSSKIPYSMINKIYSFNESAHLLDTVYRYCGQKLQQFSLTN